MKKKIRSQPAAQEAPTGRVYVSKGVSFDPQRLTKAKARVKSLGLSFSTYIQQLIENDIRQGGSFTISPDVHGGKGDDKEEEGAVRLRSERQLL